MFGIVWIGVLSTLPTWVIAAPDSLKVGDRAPAFHVASWLKGEPVQRFEPGRVYVVEFWATWCGPCRMAMPHLSALAAKYRDEVTVIGVDVKDNAAADTTDLSYLGLVEDFVDAIGDGMDYTVAVDNPAQQTWQHWMDAAGLKGIPATFVVDRSGRIAWIGHPLNGLDLVVENILVGRFDPADDEALNAEIARERENTTALLLRFHELVEAKNSAEGVAIGEELLERYPMGRSVTLSAIYKLLNGDNPAKAKDFALEKIDAFAGDPLTLQVFAKQLLDLGDAQGKEIAVLAMQQVVRRSSPRDHAVQDAMAAMYHQTGNHDAAVATQEKVIALLTGQTAIKGRDALLEKANGNLATYRAAVADAITLRVGDPAPALTAVAWLKGQPVDRFEPGQVYVVEFWATWCGPCKMAMPHLSELARKYRGKVTVVGFDVRENSYSKDKNADYLPKVTQFVERLGDGMDYTVGVDVPDDRTWIDWMVAAGLKGIPSSFVIDQAGNVVWIGHPFAGLEHVVERVLAGSFDAEASEAVAAQVAKDNEALEALRTQYTEYSKAGDDAAAFEVAERLVERSLMGKGVFMGACFEHLRKIDRRKAHRYVKEVLARHGGDPMSLQMLARSIVAKDDPKDKRLGIVVMEHAVARCSPTDMFAHSQLAETYFLDGDAKRAVKLQERIVDMVNDATLGEQSESTKTKAREDLAKYTAAL